MIRYSPRRCLIRLPALEGIFMTTMTVVSLTLAQAGQARAQERPASRPPADEEIDETNPRVACRAAARILEKGRPARLVPVANRFIIQCNDQAPAALASSMRRLRTSKDTAALNGMLRGALYVRDGGFFAAAYDVATDPAASAEARTAGWLVAAIELTDKTEFDYNEIVGTPNLWICPLLHADHSLRLAAGAPLPSDAAARVRSAAGAVPKTAPNMVFMAAQCAGIVAKRAMSP